MSPFPPFPAVEHYVFNGDADGLCALQQLRLAAFPVADKTPRLVTGVKRDIELLARLDGVRDSAIAVLDLSLDKNRAALARLLSAGNHVLYIDHHHAGEIPASPLLRVHIDPSPLLCTSLIVDQLLEGRHAGWAVVGAFGDNLVGQAENHARTWGIDRADTAALRELGTLLNYNGYGESPVVLHVHPEQLAREMADFVDPRGYIEASTLLPRIRAGYAEDMGLMRDCRPCETFSGGRVFLLPDAPWAQRVLGIFANQCANEAPDAAHAILQQQGDNSFRVSVRAPKNNPTGADGLCRLFDTGGGRAAAAGINRLADDELERFLALFRAHFSA